MEDIAEIRELTATASTDRGEMSPFIIDYVHTMLLLEIAVIAANHMVKKKRRQRRVWAWPYLQKRMEQGHHHNLMEELSTEAQDLYKNFTQIDRSLFNKIVEQVTPYIQKKVKFWRKPIEPGLRVAITLRFLATGDSYKSLQYSFWVAHNTISYIVPVTCRVIVAAFGDEELQVPHTPEAWQEVARGFEEQWNFPHIFGAVDGKHIRLCNPPRGGTHYFNCKEFYSMVLLAVADASYKFLYVDMGATGSESDGGVFAQTRLGEIMLQEEANLPQPEALPGQPNGSPVDYFLVGDDAFPLILLPYEALPQKRPNQGGMDLQL
ncbi:uncharacterized protein [Macrobrachium rosenbergii]|uniref:uncharacterized protein n=1 Tax=Macrobrachium rosenbergii TaxID=79674 RepID=UPI0034D6ECCC